MEGSAGLVRCSLRAWRRCLGAVVMVGGVGWAIERSGHIYIHIYRMEMIDGRVSCGELGSGGGPRLERAKTLSSS